MQRDIKRSAQMHYSLWSCGQINRYSVVHGTDIVVLLGTLIALIIRMNSMNLSMLLSALWTMATGQLGAHESVDAYYAPSECHSLVARGFGKRVHSAIVAGGYADSDHLTRSVTRLGAGKWLHFSPIGYALAAASEYEETVCA